MTLTVYLIGVGIMLAVSIFILHGMRREGRFELAVLAFGLLATTLLWFVVLPIAFFILALELDR